MSALMFLNHFSGHQPWLSIRTSHTGRCDRNARPGSGDGAGHGYSGKASRVAVMRRVGLRTLAPVASSQSCAQGPVDPRSQERSVKLGLPGGCPGPHS